MEVTEQTTTQVNSSSSKNFEKKKTVFRAHQLIWYVVGLINTLLGLRFILKLLGSNESTGFVDLVYTLSAPFAALFRGVLPTSVSGVSEFEWSTLIAMVIYGLVGFGIIKLFGFVKPAEPSEVESTVRDV